MTFFYIEIMTEMGGMGEGGKPPKKKIFVVVQYILAMMFHQRSFFFPSYIHKIKTCTRYLKILLDFSMIPYHTTIFDLISSLLKTHNQASKQASKQAPPPFSSAREFGIEFTVGKTRRNGETGKREGLFFRLTYLIYISYIHVHIP